MTTNYRTGFMLKIERRMINFKRGLNPSELENIISESFVSCKRLSTAKRHAIRVANEQIEGVGFGEWEQHGEWQIFTCEAVVGDFKYTVTLIDTR